VIDLKWLKSMMEREVLEAYDHRHLNFEVPEFAAGKAIPTTENIAIAVWNRLKTKIAAVEGATLAKVRVYETPEIFAEYRGGL
jgi:6-pyruvoyltetrahydropterin/6-carboxytetrahydropterin synthase